MSRQMQRVSIHQAKEQKLSLSVELRPLIYSLGAICLITTIGLFLALQGWKSRKPAFDMMTYIYNADAFLHNGRFPQYGDVSSYGSFSPPGTSWLMLPGVLIFHDPRLFEKVGSAALHLGTLMGIFLLALAALGPRAAYLSIVLYGLSSIGLSFAGSLWPIGHPFFYVWTAYFACLWATRRDPKYFAAAIVIWAIGMYVDMAITPALIMLAVIWLFYRPQVFSWHLLLGGAFILALWYPYLHFESGRGYADIKSQLLRQNIAPHNFKDAWCNPNLTMQTWDEASNQSTANPSAPSTSLNATAGLLGRLLIRANAIKDGLLSNLIENTQMFGFSVLLLLLLIIISGLGLRGFPTRYLPRPIAAFVDRLSLSTAIDMRNQEMVAALVVCLLGPWSVLLIVAEPGRTERFLWLWPLQVILLAAAVTSLLPRLRSSDTIGGIGQVALIALIVPSAILSTVERSHQTGWAGNDAEEVKVAEYIAQDLYSQGKDQAGISYQLLLYPFMVRDHIIDPHYKVGAEFDLLFQYMYGISNTNQCAEGIAPYDEYRIVQIHPEPSEAAPKHYFEIPPDAHFRLIAQFENYQVLRRD